MSDPVTVSPVRILNSTVHREGRRYYPPLRHEGSSDDQALHYRGGGKGQGGDGQV
jgi:hypothetical protein